MTKTGFIVLFAVVGIQSTALADEVCYSNVQKIVRGTSMYDYKGSRMSEVCSSADGLALQQASDICGGATKTSSRVEYHNGWRTGYYDSCTSYVAYQCVVTCPAAPHGTSDPSAPGNEDPAS